MARIIGSKGAGAHRVVIEATKQGLRIIDRTGIYENAGFAGFVRSLEELSARYSLNGGKCILDPSNKAVLVKSVAVRISLGVPTLMGYIEALLPRLQGDFTTKHLDVHLHAFTAQKNNRPQRR